MTSLAVLIPISLGMGLVGLCAFFWAMRTGQFDDPEGNAWRVIALDEPRRHELSPKEEPKRYDRMAAHTENRNAAGRL